MSYSTNMSGRIEITPPLSWAEIKGSQHYGNGAKGWPQYPDLVFEVETESRDTAEGVLAIERAVAIVPATDYYSVRGYNAEDELRELVHRSGMAHTFNGMIEGLGEGDGTIQGIDVWRLRVVDGVVTKFVPQLVWPAESE